MKVKILLFLTLVVIGCKNADETNSSGATAVATTEVKQETVPTTQTNPTPADAVAVTGSLAGLYVMSFAGANSHFYEIRFEKGSYNGNYQEYQDGKESKVELKDIAVNEAEKTVSFKQGDKQVSGKFTEAGLAIGEDVYEKR